VQTPSEFVAKHCGLGMDCANETDKKAKAKRQIILDFRFINKLIYY